MEAITEETFKKDIICSDMPVVVDFWGPKCGPCLALMPAVEALERKYQEQVKMVKVEAPKNRRLCLSLKVLGLPTYLFYTNGKETDRLSGNVTIQEVEGAVKRLLSMAEGN